MSAIVRSFWQDVLDSEAHHVYFKKFLEFNRADHPWNFFLDVEELDKISDLNIRRKKIVAIVHTYFKKRGNQSSLARHKPHVLSATLYST